MLKRWSALTAFLDDGRICCARRARHSPRAPRLVVAGLDRQGERAAADYCLIAAAKLNRVGPQAWLADVFGRIADHPASRLRGLLALVTI
jgi:hypothetical protein